MTVILWVACKPSSLNVQKGIFSKILRYSTTLVLKNRPICSNFLFFFCLTAQIRNLWEILSGQHRTNAMDEFVNGVKAVESEWLAVLGRTLTPVFYRKMPLRLAKKLSAGFQDKESKPQVYINCYEISMPKWHMSVNMHLLLQDEIWSEIVLKRLRTVRERSKEGLFTSIPYSYMTSAHRARYTVLFCTLY